MKTPAKQRFRTLLLTVSALGISVAPSPGQETRRYAYDDAGRIVRVVHDDGTVVDYGYDNAGNRLVVSIVGPGAPANMAPLTPSDPVVPDGAIGVSQEPNLGWSGGDPDAGDVVTYALFFGPPGEGRRLYAGREASFAPARLAPRTTYEWWVVARDQRGAETVGPTWTFTTEDRPPEPEFSALPLAGAAPLTVLFFDESASDDPITGWEWDFDNDGTVDSTEQSPAHVYHAGGIYSVSLTVNDAFGVRATRARVDYVAVSDDTDADAVDDLIDNCLGVYNPQQSDVDGDGTGDYCDPDADADGIDNDIDNCPRDPNIDQADTDGDGLGDACTTAHCVGSAAELQAALDAARNNGTNDVLLLVQGAYGVDEIGERAFAFASSEPYGIVLRGGYSSGCSAQTGAASSTVLDGMGLSSVLSLESDSDAPWDRVHLEVLTITRGSTWGHAGASLRTDAATIVVVDVTVSDNDANGAVRGGLEIESARGDVRIHRSRIVGNRADTHAGVFIDNAHGATTVTNTVIAQNVATQYIAGLFVQSVTGSVVATHDTVTANRLESGWGHGGGISLDLGPTATAEVHNSIVWGNIGATGADLHVVNPNGVPLTIGHSDYHDLSITGPAAIEAANVDTDPLLVDPENLDFHLTPTSPCIDIGDSGASGLPAEDFEGDGRTLGAAPDIGADEYYAPGDNYAIAGRVVQSSVGLADIEVRLGGDASASRLTDGNGGYRFPWLAPGNYTVTPVNDLYAFDPEHRDITLIGADVTAQDFEATPRDSDGDGVPDRDDNCPATPNAGQGDTDGDGYGDACDLPGSISGIVTNEATGLPIDGATVTASAPAGYGEGTSGGDGSYAITGLENGTFNVQAAASGYIAEYYPGRVDVDPETDTPGIDFALEPDTDGDGFGDSADNCPGTINYDQSDLDGDGSGDACDPDIDEDGVPNEADNCPRDLNADQADTDGDGYGDLCTRVHCVADATGLQLALDLATYNGLNDVIRLVQGEYHAADNASRGFSYSSAEPYAIALEGGYTSGCLDRTLDAANTVLDGDGLARTLLVQASSPAAFVRHRLAGFTVRGGSYTFGAGAEVLLAAGDLRIEGVDVTACSTAGYHGGLRLESTSGNVVADRLRVSHNSAGSRAGMSFVSDSGSFELTDSVIAHNQATSDAGGIHASTASGLLRLVNNTIVANAAGAAFERGGGVYLVVGGSAGSAALHNNVVWGNEAALGADVYLSTAMGASPVEIVHSDVGNVAYEGPAPILTGVFALDPALADPTGDDFHLTLSSPCIDAGNAAAPGLPALDFEGDPRVLGAEPDIGADEFLAAGDSHAISGTVREAGAGLPGIEVRLSGDADASRVTDENGAYRIAWLAPGSYVVAPADAGYTFEPTERGVTLVDADVGGQDFDASELDTDGDGVPDRIDNCPLTHNPDQSDSDDDGYGDACDLPGSISGRVVDAVSGEGVGGALVTAAGPSYNSVYAGGVGDYTIPGLANGSYTVMASANGYLQGQHPEPVLVVPETNTPGIDVPLAPDSDGDGIGDPDDNCPGIVNYDQADQDGDGTGDVCDNDIDGDSLVNAEDNCPREQNADQADVDGDGYGDACTVNHCVFGAAQLQGYLTTAQSNGLNDVLELEAQTFSVSQNGNLPFTYASTEPYAIVLRGGYGVGCADRDPDPSGTVLDGHGVARVLWISSPNAPGPLRHAVEMLTIQGGSYYFAAGAHFDLGAADLRLEDLAVRANSTTGQRGGLSIQSTSGSLAANRLIVTGNSADSHAGLGFSSGSGDLLLTNSIVTSNTATTDAGGVYAATTSGTLRLINDTVTANGAGMSWSRGGGIYALVNGSDGAFALHNSIVWGNSAHESADLSLQVAAGAAPAEIAHNDLGDYSVEGGIEPYALLNIDADPAFVAPLTGDYHLSDASPCIDAGDAAVEGIGEFDFERDARILGFTADIGADEYFLAGTSHSIGGFVREEGQAVPGIEMRLSGDAAHSRWTNVGGEYRFGWLGPGLYTVTPTDARYLFDPIERIVTIVDGDVLGQDFAATLVDRDADGVYDSEDNCVDTPNPDQANADGDDYGDACDCQSWNPQEPPGPLGDTLHVDRNVSGQAVLTWDVEIHPQYFGVYRGSRDQGVGFAYNQACQEKISGWTMSFTDPGSTDPGGMHYFLVSQIGCAESGFGPASSGEERPNPAPCP